MLVMPSILRVAAGLQLAGCSVLFDPTVTAENMPITKH